MKKYTTIFHTSLQNEFVYRLNFIFWRVRNVLRILLTFFLWSGVFLQSGSVAGFTKPQMLTYVFLVLLVQSLVLSAPSGDRIGGEIGSGELSNYLVKPINYLKYWFTRDLSSKLLNIAFAVFELTVLYLFLKPQIILPGLFITFVFVVTVILSSLLYFFLEVSARFIAFWMPEFTWGLAFLTMVFIETLSGMIFPISLFPPFLKFLVHLTPFPYLIYYPISIFVGETTGTAILGVIVSMCLWIFVTWRLTLFLWSRGLRAYSSDGR